MPNIVTFLIQFLYVPTYIYFVFQQVFKNCTLVWYVWKKVVGLVHCALHLGGIMEKLCYIKISEVTGTVQTT